MDSTFYFYYGNAEQWLLANGAKQQHAERENEPIKVKYFDDLPKGFW